ncbi:retrovirus-related pol polyprotein from transposon TNT 1-94, partial [Tanacetum coccineum]
NLVSGWLLSKFGILLIFESDNFVLSKNQMYVGKGYALNGMFKLNVMVFMNDINKMNSSAYLIESFNVCKDEVIDKFVIYKTKVENQIGRKIKVVRSDRGGEYVCPFGDLCAKHGIRHEYLIRKKEETPYELWIGRKSSYQYLRVWGYLAKVVVLTPKAQKIGPKSVDCIFIGYAKNSSAYRFIVHDSKNPDIQKNALMESRNASFFENIFPCLPNETESSSRLDDEVVQDKRQRDDNDLHDERQDQLEEEEVEPRRSKRARTETSFGPDFVSFMVENEPTSYREAITSSEGHQWKEAIKSYKWIFKKKIKADDTIAKYKARLVIKGFRQREGLDFFYTYSPVTRITSIRMIFAIAALRNLEVHQMDVKTAFLNKDFEEEIYMNQPEGFIAPGQEGKVCRLVKSLYGLKQAPKQWHQKFDHTMLESGFKINECDKCVYVKETSSGYVILCLYVDDMLIIGRNDKMINSTKDMLKLKFDMKDMGLADVILGINIIRTYNGLVLSQAHYVDKILNTHNARDSGLARTPIDTSTRPDLTYAVSRLSRYTSNPSDAHWKAVTRVLHYLRYIRDYKLHYDRYPAVIEGYTKSIMELKFIALDKCKEEEEWLHQFVEDIPRWHKPVTAISIYCDSQSAIGIAHIIMYNAKYRHIRRRHSIRQLLSTGVISIDYVKSKDNIADPLTKGLSEELVSKSSKGKGLKSLKE